MTRNVDARVKAHNAGKTTSTRNKGPWVVVYTEQLLDRGSAWNRERQIKKYKGGGAFKKILGEVA